MADKKLPSPADWNRIGNPSQPTPNLRPPPKPHHPKPDPRDDYPRTSPKKGGR